jgi:hypothetical protein
MSIGVRCPCVQWMRIADESGPRSGFCPACGTWVTIPDGGAEATALASSLGEPVPPTLVPAGWPTGYESDEDKRSPYSLFSPVAIGVVGFLAGPVGAFVLLGLNYMRLGKRRAAFLTATAGVLTVAAVLVLGILAGTDRVGPGTVARFPILIPLYLIFCCAAWVLQRGDYEAHWRDGGETASGWTAAGIGLLGWVLYFGVWAVASVAYAPFQKVEFGGGEEVYYRRGATAADARKLGEFLREAGYFDGQNPTSVLVSRAGDRLVVSFVVAESAIHSADARDGFRASGRQASERVFDGRPVTVELCDEALDVVMRL